MELGRPRERHLLHFEAPFGSAADGALTFHVAGDEYPLQAHTASTRAEARGENPLLALYPDDELTHYVEAELPSAAIALKMVTRTIMVDKFPLEEAVSLAIHVPREGRIAEAAEAIRKGQGGPEFHPKLALRAGEAVDPSLVALAMQRPDLLHDVLDPFETAAALLYQHPGLINLSVENGGTIPSVILRQCIGRAIRQRSTIVDRIQRYGSEWCRYVRLKDGDEFVNDENGVPFLTMELHDRVHAAIADPLALALKYSQQLMELKHQTWDVQYGLTSRPEPEAMTPRSPAMQGTSAKWTKKALSSEWGVAVDQLRYTDPVPGGWTIGAIWVFGESRSERELANALLGGTAFIRIDVEPPQDYRAVLPGQNPPPETAATFRARFPGLAAELRLDPLRTDLSVQVTREPDGPPTQRVSRVQLGIVRDGTDEVLWTFNGTRDNRGELRVTARNAWLRQLSVYAEFFDAGGAAIRPGPLVSLPPGVGDVFDRHPTKRYVDSIGPISVIFGVLLPPEPVTLRIPFPDNAAKMRLYWGGLGTGKYDEAVCALGITATATFQLALPVVLLAAGAADYKTDFVSTLLKDKMVLYSLYGAAAGLVGDSAVTIGRSQNPAAAAKAVAIRFGPMIAKFAAKKGAAKFAVWLARKISEGAVRRAVPLVNAAFLAFDAAVTLAQLGQTIAAVIQSPFYYDFEITRSFDLHVKIRPDPRFGTFPDHRDRMRVQVVYDTAGELRHFETTDLRDRVSTPIDVTFADSPAGGHTKVFVFFYANNHWQSAAGSTPWFEARGQDGTPARQVELTIENALIPLSSDSVYEHQGSIVFEDGQHRWKLGPAPEATPANEPDSSNQLLTLNGITVAQRPGMFGYAWQATGLGLPRDRVGTPPVDDALYVVQNLSLREHPSSGHALSPVGFTLQSGIAYELASADDGSGRNFFLDPSRGAFDPESNPAGGHHLRHVRLPADTPPLFEVASGRSWGRFPERIDSFVVTQNHVAGITGAASKIYILRLPDAAVADADARMASLASGEGARDGLMSQPRAIAVALDGRLLVLEQGNGRVQCFDLTGNPVPYFRSPDGTPNSSPVLPLRGAESTNFLDLSVEANGYLFVLGHQGHSASAKAEDYRVDIYEPDGTFLVATPGVAAGKIAVDLARGMFTLNWETLRGPNGRTEPSVSRWVPPPPDPLGVKS
jgi:hypothetical protein